MNNDKNFSKEFMISVITLRINYYKKTYNILSYLLVEDAFGVICEVVLLVKHHQ